MILYYMHAIHQNYFLEHSKVGTIHKQPKIQTLLRDRGGRCFSKDFTEGHICVSLGDHSYLVIPVTAKVVPEVNR